MTQNQSDINAVLAFWFDETPEKNWFFKDSDFDVLIKRRFEASVSKALTEELDDWAQTQEGLLALIILLDQMTRNLYRGTAMMFAGDEKALALSLEGQTRGYLDSFTNPYWRQFLLMPMMHAEDLAIQDASLHLFEKYTNPRTHEYAILHRDIIARFGHFPHRSTMLGRALSTEEEAFLKEENSSF